MSQPARIEWIDELKGLILLLVCASHFMQSVPYAYDILEALRPMRMSCFFFISGLLFSTRRHPTLSAYASSKTRSLLLPYLMLSVLFMLLDPRLYSESLLARNYDPSHRLMPWLMPFVCEPIHAGREFLAVNVAEIFVGGFGPCLAQPIWFVFTLYMGSLIWYAVQQSRHTLLWVTAILIADVGLSFWPMHILPFNMGAALTASLFIGAGSLAKRMFLASLQNGSDRMLMCILLSCSAAYLLVQPGCGFVHLQYNLFGNNIALFTLASLTGIAAMLALFPLLSRHRILPRCRIVLRVVAQNALVILPTHMAIKALGKMLLQPLTDSPLLLSAIMLPLTIALCIAAIILFRGPLHALIMKPRAGIKECLTAK